MLRTAPVLLLLATACRSMSAYEPLIDPVDYLDLRLEPCPQSPNCVSSQSWSPDQRVEPLAFAGDPGEALDRLAELVEAEPGARVVERRGILLRAEYRSRIFGFTDDLSLLADEAGGVIHVRSASRIGWSDLGVNRRRVDALREAFSHSMLPIP